MKNFFEDLLQEQQFKVMKQASEYEELREDLSKRATYYTVCVRDGHIAGFFKGLAAWTKEHKANVIAFHVKGEPSNVLRVALIRKG